MFQDGPEETISSASAEAVPRPPRKFQPGIPKLPPEVIRPQQPRLTHSTRNTEHERPATPVALRMVDLALDNLAKQDWFHPLPLQRLQALLTLFPKSFSPFPHGTCLLSVSNQYLALDEIYHPICAPIPRNVTLRTQAVHEGLQMTDGTLTLTDALFQEAYICAFVGIASRDYNSRPEAPISMLSSSLFIRHY